MIFFLPFFFFFLIKDVSIVLIFIGDPLLVANDSSFPLTNFKGSFKLTEVKEWTRLKTKMKQVDVKRKAERADLVTVCFE